MKELDPKTYKQSMKSLNWEQLREAALKEYTCFIVKYMWWLVPRLARQKIIHCKWIFNTKLNVDESLEKLKARLVALGFSWIKGIYFNEVFSATSPQESFRILLSVMENKGRSGQSLDIRGSLLNRNLNKKIYMTQPEGFVRPEKPDGVCEIIRSLYGLKKKSPHHWNKKFHEFLIGVKLTKSSHDPSIYFSRDKSELKAHIVTHIYNLVVTGTSEFIKTCSKILKNKFEISKDEPLYQFLSLRIQQEFNKMASSNQSHYIDELVDRLKPSCLTLTKAQPRDDFEILVPSTSEKKIDKTYSSMIAGLFWISQCTCPDVAFAVNRLSQFIQLSNLSHWEAAIRVLL